MNPRAAKTTGKAATKRTRARSGPRRVPAGQIRSVNPTTGETLATFELLAPAQVVACIERAASAFRDYRRTPLAERSRWLLRTAAILEERKDEYGRLMTLEMGKPIGAAVEEVRKCALACRYYAEHGASMLADEPADTGGGGAFVRFQPLGPVLAVMPWNFPFWQVFRFAAPALMAGNVALLKHASNVPQCAQALERIFADAGFAPGVFQTLLISAAQVASVIDDDRVVAVTLTGSGPAGSAVASRAGARIKKTVLELGGSDPFIVLSTADVAEAARVAVTASTINNGQSCIAAKRFIVVEPVAEEFTRGLVQGMEALRVGDPTEPETQIGPLATADIVRDLDEQVRRSVQAGARVLVGGHRLDGPGNYYAPTVITDVPPGSPAYHEELFGPVAVLFPVRDGDEALALANDSTFGLGASVWTNDERERARFIDEIETGLVFVNGMVASDPRLPFGGVKRSGYGRELAAFGPREFTNIKTVWIRNGAPGPARATE